MTTKRAKKAEKPCDRCGLCDLARFVGWRERVEQGLGKKINERSKRFELVQEIHEDVARRHPLGIAVVLAEAIRVVVKSKRLNKRESLLARTALKTVEAVADDQRPE